MNRNSAHRGPGDRSAPGLCLAVLLMLAVFAAAGSPAWARPQLEISSGFLWVPEPSVGAGRIGPLASLGLFSDALGVPLFFEVGAARTDFTSLGQDYHHNHYLFTVGSEWSPMRGNTRLGVRLGAGASGEYEIVETHPSAPGGDNWVETVLVGLILRHDLRADRQLVVVVSDHVLGPYFAVLDPSEYSVDHRVRVTVGVRF